VTRGYISIGSNIEKDKNILLSLKALQNLFGKLVISSIYESDPVGFSGDSFFNVVVGFDSDLDVKTVANHLRQIELDQGRTRDCKKFSARTLDLDLILYGDLILTDEKLQIPREEINRYAFVLEPLAEIAGNLPHPSTHKTFAQMWKDFDKSNLTQCRVTPNWQANFAPK
jgi:2-amino-4-hydroxy-6-hydroxymethyldihydropteridine diphosphokinase